MRPESNERSYPCLGESFQIPKTLLLARLATALILLGLFYFLELSPMISAAILAAAALVAGYDILIGAIEDTLALEFRRERLPLLLAVLLSFAIGRGQDAAIALFLLQLTYIAAEYALYMTQKTISTALETEMSARENRTGDCSGLLARMRTGYAVMTDREQLLMKIGSYLLPAATVLSLVLAVVLPLVYELPLKEAVKRAATVIALASPTSLLLFLPLTYFSAMAALRRKGTVFTSASAVENAGALKSLVFDKLGTLADQEFRVVNIKTEKLDAATFLKVAAHAADQMDTPAAKAVVKAYGGELNEAHMRDVRHEPGEGVLLNVDEVRIHFGTAAYFEKQDLNVPKGEEADCQLYMAVNGIYAGSLTLTEGSKEDVSSGFVTKLAGEGIEAIAMVSGDSREKDRALASQLRIEEYYSECTTEDKLKVLHTLKEKMGGHGKLALVAGTAMPEKLLCQADFSLVIVQSCGEERTALADALIINGSVGSLLALIRTGKQAGLVTLAGIGLVSVAKLLLVVLAALGYAPLWFAVLLDGCASLGALLGCTTYLLRK